MSKRKKVVKSGDGEPQEPLPQIILTFHGEDSLNFRQQLIGVDAMQLVAASVWLDEQARLLIRQKIIQTQAQQGKRVVIPTARAIPKA